MLIKQTEATYDVAIVGGGILGLAHAYHAARRGLRVGVFERSPKAQGASMRNFGLIWPIGQSSANYALAMRSREIWLEVLRASGLYHQPTGSLHLSYRDDEAAVAQEFAREGPKAGFNCEWLERKQVLGKSSAVRGENLLGALWSPTEVTVDPRQVLSELPGFLSTELSVEFHYGAAVNAIEPPRVLTGNKQYRASKVVICPGSELNHLYSDQLNGLGLALCKLQMMRTAPQPNTWHLGPALAGGLTLRFYPSFQICSSLGLLRARIASETPEYDRWGIHTMVSQGADGSLTFGDSHEYGGAPSPFSSNEIDAFIFSHINGYLAAPDMKVAERWYGLYVKHPDQPYCELRVEPNVAVVTGAGGAGMTLSFGIAERVVESFLSS